MKRLESQFVIVLLDEASVEFAFFNETVVGAGVNTVALKFPGILWGFTILFVKGAG